MDDEKKPPLNSTREQIWHGTPPASDSSYPLRKAYWNLVKLMGISDGIWKNLIRQHVNDPEYLKQFRDSKLTTMTDRVNRLNTSLTGGSVRNLTVDFTWKRFIEGLVILEMQTLTVTLLTKRGSFDTKCFVFDSTFVREDFIRNLRNENRKKRKERFEHPASHDVNEYVANIDHTIEHVMKHILLRLIYKVIRGYKIDGDKLERWTTNYVNNPKLCPGTSSKRGDRRNNMKQAMRHTEAITWRWFLIILQALDVREFEITFKVRHRSGREYEVSDNVPLATYRFWSSNETEQP